MLTFVQAVERMLQSLLGNESIFVNESGRILTLGELHCMALEERHTVRWSDPCKDYDYRYGDIMRGNTVVVSVRKCDECGKNPATVEVDTFGSAVRYLCAGCDALFMGWRNHD